MYLTRAEARSLTSGLRWEAVLEETSGNCHGSLVRPAVQIDPNITHVSICCDMPNVNLGGHAFPSTLTLCASIPFIGGGPEILASHPVTIKFFAEGLQSIKVVPVNNAIVVPYYIRQLSEFAEGKVQLYKVDIEFKTDGLVCDGLFIPEQFSDWPALMTMDALRKLFSFDNGKFTLWVREELATPFHGPIAMLSQRHILDTQGSFYEKFYQGQPIAVIDEMAQRPNRPNVTYFPSLPVSLNLTEMLTKYAAGVYELHEFQQASANEFNETSFVMKTFKVHDGGTDNLVYLGLLKPTKEIALTPREGDKLTIFFTQSEQWSARVIAPLRHYMSGYISITLCRPRKAHPAGTTQFVRANEVLGYVETDLGCGELAAVDDEAAFVEIMRNLPTFEVKAKIVVSDTTARRQIHAIEAFQRGARYNIRKNVVDDTYKPWTDNDAVKSFGQWMLLRNTVPKSHHNWLGNGVKYVEHFKDTDQRDAIDHLFCKAPAPVGVLVGPAGTGKTVLMASLIKAHVKAYNSTHIVGTPSNVGADVAGKVIQSMFKSDEALKGKIVMRAYHEGSESSTVPDRTDNGGSSPSRSSNSSQLSTADVGLYSADGWYDIDAIEAKKVAKELLNVYQKAKAIRDVNDPRMDLINQSLNYHALCTAGFAGFPSNDYTNMYKSEAAAFRKLFGKLVKDGENGLDLVEMKAFRTASTKLYTFTIKKASVLLGTLTYLGHKQYVSCFQEVDTFWTDEAGQASVPDWLNIPARYSFKQAFLLGDPNQLHPVVVGPSPLTGFMRALEMSPIQLLLDARWPSVTLTDNRRSAQGIIDIPSKLFYKGVVKAHPNSADHEKHMWSTPIANLIHEKFSVEGDGTSPTAVAFFDSASPSKVDPLSRSTYNTGNQAFCLNFIEHSVIKLGVLPQDIGYTSPYQAQCKKMQAALRKLENKYKGVSTFSLVKVAPIDSYQGGSRKIMIGDYTSSEKLGFMSARGRNCVLLTRAEDFALYIGSRRIRAPRNEVVNYPALAFAHGRRDKVSRDLGLDHEWMKHEFAA